MLNTCWRFKTFDHTASCSLFGLTLRRHDQGPVMPNMKEALCSAWASQDTVLSMGKLRHYAQHGQTGTLCSAWASWDSVLSMGKLGQCAQHGQAKTLCSAWASWDTVLNMGKLGQCAQHGQAKTLCSAWASWDTVLSMDKLEHCAQHGQAGTLCSAWTSWNTVLSTVLRASWDSVLSMGKLEHCAQHGQAGTLVTLVCTKSTSRPNGIAYKITGAFQHKICEVFTLISSACLTKLRRPDPPEFHGINLRMKWCCKACIWLFALSSCAASMNLMPAQQNGKTSH